MRSNDKSKTSKTGGESTAATTGSQKLLFHDALASRLDEVLRRIATVVIEDPHDRAAHRITTAAAVVREMGMPARHQAARLALSSAAGVYDGRFRPAATPYPGLVPGASLAWQTDAGLVADVCFADARLESRSPQVRRRVERVRQWAAEQQVSLATVNVLPLARPSDAEVLPGLVSANVVAEVAS